MKLSLYTLLFERENRFYLYNSETEFLSSIPEFIYEKLHDGAFDELEEDALKVLVEKK